MDEEVPLSFVVGRAFAGRGKAYVYVIFSRHWHFVYVGETGQRGGPVCRLGQHLSDLGTLRKCLMEYDGIEVEDVTDLHMVALPMPNDYAFISLDSECRRGVEYLLHKRLTAVEWEPYLNAVAEVHPPTTTTLPEIQETAERFFNIVEAFYRV